MNKILKYLLYGMGLFIVFTIVFLIIIGNEITMDNSIFWAMIKTLFFVMIFALIYLFGYKYYMKNKKAEEKTEVVVKKPVKRIDYVKESLKLLERAQEEFKKGEKKEAYVTSSYAIRFYFSHKYKLKEELNSTETIKLLREESYPRLNNVKDCFSYCDLVKFAKYEANKNDFEKIIKLGKIIIK